jgi:hypothetical protein
MSAGDWFPNYAAQRCDIEDEGDPKGWSTVLVTALGSWGKHRERYFKEWSTVLVSELGSVLGKPVIRGH